MAPKKTPKRPPICSLCGNPVKGHVGPYGKKCKMSIGTLQDTVIDTVDSSEPTLPPSQSTNNINTANLETVNVHSVNQGTTQPIAGIAGTDQLAGAMAFQPQMNELITQVAKLTAEMAALKVNRPARVISSSSSDSSSDSQYRRDVDRRRYRRHRNTDTLERHDAKKTVCLSNGARITVKKYKQAQNAEFVNLNEFLPMPSTAHRQLAADSGQPLQLGTRN